MNKPRSIVVGLANTILFILPFVSGFFLLLNSRGSLIFRGLVLIIGTVVFYVSIFPIEKIATKITNLKTQSYLMPILYFALVNVSITLSWLLINSNYPGEFWVFLFAFSCCYLPYNYMLQGEQAKAGKVGTITNVTNNYSIFGYLLFGTLMNFTTVGNLWSHILVILLGLFLLIGLPKKIQKEMLMEVTGRIGSDHRSF